MSTTTVGAPLTNSLTAGKLPKHTSLAVLAASWLVAGAVFLMLQLSGASEDFNIAGTLVFGTVLYGIAIYLLSYFVEGVRKAKDRLVTALVTAAFVVALLPLVSLVVTTVTNGLPAFLTPTFFTSSQRNVVGAGGGALHAVVGTLLIGVLLNGLQLNNVSSYSQQIIIGLIIVLAVAFDTFAKSRRRTG